MALRGTATYRGGSLGSGSSSRKSLKLNPYRLGTYKAPVPPPGTYDPALDAQRRAASRGLLDAQQDTGLGDRRSGEDFQFGLDDVNRGLTRGTADLDTAQARGGEDHARNIAMLQRSYTRLAGQQRQQSAVAGVSQGGAMLQAAQKRQANMAFDQQPLDTDFSRMTADITRDRGRLTEDTDLAKGRLGVDFSRGSVDRRTGLDRATREDEAFGRDILAQQTFQATQGNWQPPPSPAQSAYARSQAAARKRNMELLARAKRRR